MQFLYSKSRYFSLLFYKKEQKKKKIFDFLSTAINFLIVQSYNADIRGPSYSKLTMSLVDMPLKHIFSAKIPVN